MHNRIGQLFWRLHNRPIFIGGLYFAQLENMMNYLLVVLVVILAVLVLDGSRKMAWAAEIAR
jgi:hypothetical protein